MVTMITIFLLLFLVILTYHKVKSFFSYWKVRQVPQYNIWTIIYKTVIDILQGNPFYEGQREMYNKFENTRYYGAYEFLRPKLFIKDPELIKELTIKEFKHFVDHTQFIPLDGDPILENSLFLLTGEKWRRVRNSVSPIFTNSKIKLLFQVVCECSHQLLEYIENQSPATTEFEMRDLLGKLTSDTIFSTIFGLKINSLINSKNPLYNATVSITNFDGFKPHLKYILLQIVPKICKALGIQLLNQKLCTFFKQMVVDTIDVRKHNNIKQVDMINLLMEAQKNNTDIEEDVSTDFRINKGVMQKNCLSEKCPFTNDLTTAVVINFLGAGYDSVVTLLSFMLYELALNASVQEKLCSEIDEIYEENNGKPTYDVVMKMQYLDMCICETLRKWPSAMYLDRICSQPYTIQPTNPNEPPIHLKVGDPIGISLFGLHYDPKYYPNPNKFDPERFSSTNRSNIDPYVYLPFGIGPRFCVGNRYALVQVKTLIFYFLQKYTVAPCDRTRHPRILRKYFQLHPKEGIWLNVQRRF